uniref:Uncharacterized protein n=1 Tax=viral metagenome TaxID=1070528 RepID=A0A6C0IA21_9ZZZZ
MSQIKKKYEPWEELPEENLQRVKIATEAIHKAMDSIEYNLATDTIKVPGQNWACVSFVSPTSNQKNKSLGMKIRGVFDKHDEAVDYVKQLIRLDPTFDIFICEMYNWCLVPPDPENIKDQVYQNEELNKLVSEYHKNRIYAKEHFEERKREMMEHAAEQAKQDALKKLNEPLPDYTHIIEPKTLTLINGDTVSASDVMESML